MITSQEACPINSGCLLLFIDPTKAALFGLRHKEGFANDLERNNFFSINNFGIVPHIDIYDHNDKSTALCVPASVGGELYVQLSEFSV